MHTGKGMKMAPKAKLNDGLIDIILFRKASKLRVFKIFTEVFSGNHINDPLVEYYQVSKFKIRTSEESLNLDGENKGRTPISVNMLPKSLNIFVNL
jgi:diacylglycerol kinase (ATP)